MTSRLTPAAFVNLVEELGTRQDREDLRIWMGFKPKDEEDKAAWLAAHPEDPLALAAARTRQRKLAERPEPAAAAAGAAALAENSLKASARTASGSSNGGVVNGAGGQTLNPPQVPNGKPLLSMSSPAERPGWMMLAPIIAGIVGMLWLATLMRSEVISEPRLPAIGNATLVTPSCPAGQVPAELLAPPPLEHGEIIIDE